LDSVAAFGVIKRSGVNVPYYKPRFQSHLLLLKSQRELIDDTTSDFPTSGIDITKLHFGQKIS
jgi:hypothetical protein